ncbi:amino acid/amide ABC transporter membrane protein 2, HAAT family [Lentzea waywayandensis]|uniref:Amino acid/amide ABC transporter membrane protein 2, HAAT family n=1 Tax=Lentzea waywayandensis TaxID=84724 RepID=A0A1I6FFA4_9PSEU|nr:branched-chain amino acid ABC transporter permease [Lentzea waywayandensis]SFR28631.1 amino acid/amide ABC transporter membrane protein 2, HAAT family [Lentzea waywayandensis]
MKRPTTIKGRPELYTSYKQDMGFLNTRPKRAWSGGLVVVALVLPFMITDDLLQLLATGFVAAIGAIGLNIVTGYAGQVSLGHAFFLAIGAYTGAALSGPETGRVIGFGITSLPIWLLASGLVAALFGVLVAPVAVRLRGLYLAIVTLGLVFLGEHVFREWTSLTGGPGVGRPAAVPELFGVRLDQDNGMFTAAQQLYLLMFVLLVIFGVLARNLVRSRVGRAFAAVRDRDLAASVIGVDLTKYKVLAFAVSSFYAGVAGALLFVVNGFFDPGSFNLLLSVQYIAMVLIGGAGTISGAIMGALFITLLPRITRELPTVLPFISGDATGVITVFQLEAVLYGVLIIVFLIVEPRGLFGIWVRVRNYWRTWPFSY